MINSIADSIGKKTGVALPLASLRTKNSPVIGEYLSLPEFAEFCKKAGLSIIQLLPVLDTGTQSSPYSSLSAFALHPIYISLTNIPVFQSCYDRNPAFKSEYDEFLKLKDDRRFNYEKVLNLKESMLRKIYAAMVNTDSDTINARKQQYLDWIEENAGWLKPYCVFKNLKYKYMQAGWIHWAKEDMNITREEILKRWDDQTQFYEMDFYAWEQFTAQVQFSMAAEKVREMGIILKGDLPILLNEDSCDVWSCPELFNMKLRAGSPPDGDNPTGQNWGFPVYDWKAQEENGFSWWKLRLSQAEKFFDAYRLDHIPGFFRFWAVNYGEKTAELGFTEPSATITASSLNAAGFSSERTRWLSQPHVPTEEIFRLTGNLDLAHDILQTVCDRIGHEELWLFKKNIKTSSDITNADLAQFDIDEEIQAEIKSKLEAWWKNRTLIEIKKGNFVAACNYGRTRAWNSLSDTEKNNLQELIEKQNKKQDSIWKSQAQRIFSQIIPSTKMIPCGEDLGISIDCMSKTMEKFGILGLKVVRWCRNWSEEGKPFQKFTSYKKLSLVTTGVHDSSTLRQW